MNFTLLVVALVLTHVYLVAGMDPGTCASTSTGTAKAKDPGCTVVESKNKLQCMKGETEYGFLTYGDQGSQKLWIGDIRVHKPYQNKGVATVLLKYLIDEIATGHFKQIELCVDNGHQNVHAVALYTSANFIWDHSSIFNYAMVLNL
ncbi:acetyltransferase (GNAT) family domain-containing protein [Ditylenchus destructor]|nr:acetyltransferase (GNAT) family domain-containing protein [Ditylenchus destructor]